MRQHAGAGAFFLPMTLEKHSPCKVNLLLNILGRRPDGFHELETVMHPVGLCDRLLFQRGGQGIHLTCSAPELPVDSNNLVYRAAAQFLHAAGLSDGVRIELEKRIPVAAGLGGGSGNGATALLGLNELFDRPLSPAQLETLAAGLGSDVPFFLQSRPALATGRGEKIEPLEFFPALHGAAFLLIHPGFGIATAWAYQQLARFPAARQGQPGRARRLIDLLQTADLRRAGAEFYNALEAPAIEKHPILALYQEFLRAQGVGAALMSGSGSTTFALAQSEATARELEARFKVKFGPCWTAVAPVETAA
jgi:4-diphosphocytidyl-2-C-methyl-D-erythritol kinase